MQNFKLKQTSEQVQKAIDNALYPDKELTKEGVPADSKSVGIEIKKNSIHIGTEAPTNGETVWIDTGNVSVKYRDPETGTFAEVQSGGSTDDGSVKKHNVSETAHNDIRLLLAGLSERLNAIADSDDTTLDQLSEIVAYIKANKTLIESVTTSKVNVADIVDNLTTNVSDRPLSAKMGVELRRLISTVENSANNAMSQASSAQSMASSAMNHASSAEEIASSAMNHASSAEEIASSAMQRASSAEQMASAAQAEIEKLKENGIGGGITEETDPTVPAWSKEPEKPKYTASEVGARPSTWTPSAEDVGADASGTADSKVTAHNTSDESHNDIRLLITGLTTRLNALANSTDEELDQLAEIVAYTKANKSLIDSITTSKVSVVDIIDNLTTSVSNKPLSAKMGVELKKLIDAIEIPTALPASDVYDWAKQPQKPIYTAGEVGAASKEQFEQLSTAIVDLDIAIINKPNRSDIPTVTQNTGDSETEIMSQAAVTGALEHLTTLPYGGSKAWLELNGDKTQLYQIEGYIWGYVEAEGWTKSEVQFLVVDSESKMTNTGGTPYILRNGNEGAVYNYHEASGDAGVQVYESLPESANDDDIVAVGDRKYKAKNAITGYEPYTELLPTCTVEAGKRASASAGGFVSDIRYVIAYYVDVTEIMTRGTPRIQVTFDSAFLSFVQMVGYWDKDKNFLGVILHRNDNEESVNGEDHTFRLGYRNGSKVDYYDKIAYISIDCQVISQSATESDKAVFKRIIDPDEERAPISELEWTDIGEYIPPVEEGWSATGEIYSVIDSLPVTANNGESAVYSTDGYVYSYINGSDWMQMSKYDAPTLAIDGELSGSSKNAIQNKVVANALNELNAEVNANKNNIDAVNERIANMETGSGTVTVPSFWQSAVDVAIAKIKALQTGKNCITFPFFSDNHTRNGYVGILISHIMKECSIPYAFFGGDAISSGYITESDMIVQDKGFDTAMSYIPDGRFCRAVGNHDGFWNDNGTKGWYTRDKVYELFIRAEGIAQNKHFGDDGTYYYIDDIASKVRWVILNTNRDVISAGGESIDSVQLEWLQNTALSFDESGWGVVIISHCPISNHYHANVSNAAEVIAAVNAADVDIIGWYSGHIHRDRMYTHSAVGSADGVEGTDGDALGFTQVTITSDHTGIAYDNATKHTVANDDQSHAIDFVTINKSTRTVNLTRLGIGGDRSYTY